jgi:hypothetical protein
MKKMGRMQKGLKQAIKFTVGNGYYTTDNLDRCTIENDYGYLETMCFEFDVEQTKMTEEEWTEFKNEMWNLILLAGQWLRQKDLV